MQKTCTVCNTTKDISEFNKNKNSKDGHRAACKQCMSAYRKANSEKIKKQKDEWAKNNIEKVKEGRRKYRQENFEKISKQKKEWYQKNIDSCREKNRLQHQRYKEQGIKSDWAKNNPDRVREIKRNYKHKRRQIEKSSSLSTKDFKSWVDSQEKVCKYCGVCCQSNYHVDHMHPLSKGGQHSLDNLAIACPTCNLTKSSKPLNVWLQEISQEDIEKEEVTEVEDKKP